MAGPHGRVGAGAIDPIDGIVSGRRRDSRRQGDHQRHRDAGGQVARLCRSPSEEPQHQAQGHRDRRALPERMQQHPADRVDPGRG